MTPRWAAFALGVLLVALPSTVRPGNTLSTAEVILEGVVDDTAVVSRPMGPKLRAMLAGRDVERVASWSEVSEEAVLRGRYARRYGLGPALARRGAALLELRVGKKVRVRFERGRQGLPVIVEILDI